MAKTPEGQFFFVLPSSIVPCMRCLRDILRFTADDILQWPLMSMAAAVEYVFHFGSFLET
jgi:hypothetical protein